MGGLAAFGTGAAAGLALAAPLGAIGVLLIREGAVRGLRRGAPAAVAVATVDLLYCIAAVAAASAVAPVVASWGASPRIAAGAVLVALAGWNLVRAGRPGGADEATRGVREARGTKRYALFLALTALNPATLVYFAAVVTGLSGVLRTLGSASLFVAGVALASLAWQLLLVGVGAGIGAKTGPRFSWVTTVLGNVTIAVLGVTMIVTAVGR